MVSCISTDWILVVLHDEKYTFMSELIMTCYHLRKAINQGQASAFEILEYYISLRYNAGDLDHIPVILTRFVNEFQISLSVDNSNDFKGPYTLTQVICNYLYKSDGELFDVCLMVVIHRRTSQYWRSTRATTSFTLLLATWMMWCGMMTLASLHFAWIRRSMEIWRLFVMSSWRIISEESCGSIGYTLLFFPNPMIWIHLRLKL